MIPRLLPRLHPVACLSCRSFNSDVALCSIEGDGGEDHELLAIHLHYVHWRVGIPAKQLGLDVLHAVGLLADREQPGKEKY